MTTGAYTLKTSALSLPPRAPPPPVTHRWWGNAALTVASKSQSPLLLTDTESALLSRLLATNQVVIGVDSFAAVVKTKPPQAPANSLLLASPPPPSTMSLAISVANSKGVNDVIETVKSLKQPTITLTARPTSDPAFSLDNLMNISAPSPSPGIQILPPSAPLLTPPLTPPSSHPLAPFAFLLLDETTTVVSVPTNTPLFASSASLYYLPQMFVPDTNTLDYTTVSPESSQNNFAVVTFPTPPEPGSSIVGVAVEKGKLFVALGKPRLKDIINMSTWNDFDVVIGYVELGGAGGEKATPTKALEQAVSGEQPEGIMARLVGVWKELRGPSSEPPEGITEAGLAKVLEEAMDVTKEGNLRARVERLESEVK